MGVQRIHVILLQHDDLVQLVDVMWWAFARSKSNLFCLGFTLPLFHFLSVFRRGGRCGGEEVEGRRWKGGASLSKRGKQSGRSLHLGLVPRLGDQSERDEGTRGARDERGERLPAFAVGWGSVER